MRLLSYVSCADSVLVTWPFAPTLANPRVERGGADAEFVCGDDDRFASSDKGCGPESKLRRIRSWHESKPFSEARSALRGG